MKSAEFTHYQFMATLDRRTCARCGSRDGEVYKLSEMNQGENAPPMHARCRCTIVAYDGVGNGQRVAGRERLPEGVTYKQWRARYIDGLPTATANGKFAAGDLPVATALKWKRQANFSTSDENVQSTNPNYNLGKAFRENCQKCVPAYEMRMRGYDVTARPTFNPNTDGFAQKHWSEAFENAVVEGGFAGSGKDEIVKRMKMFGDGARGEVYVAWEKDSAHVFVVENRNGVIHFLDPQTGELDVEYYFDHVKDGLTRLIRIDNLEPNEKHIKWCCKEVK